MKQSVSVAVVLFAVTGVFGQMNFTPSMLSSPQIQQALQKSTTERSTPPAVSSGSKPPSSYTPSSTPYAVPAYAAAPPSYLTPSAPVKDPSRGTITFIAPGGSAAAAATGNAPFGSQQPQKYIITGNDCLWNLSGTFLNDTWSWKKIWELNPYVVNPNLIYPGDSLLIPGYMMAYAGTDARALAAPSVMLPRRSFDEETAGFLDTTATADSLVAPAASDLSSSSMDLATSAAHFLSKKVFTPEFLAMVPFLWFTKDARGDIAPGNGRIVPSSDQREFGQYENASIRPMVKGSRYTIGDTLEILRCERTLYFKKTPCVLVRRIGYARVEESSSDKTRITLFKIWDVIKAGDRVGTPAVFKSDTVSEVLDPQVTLVGTVFERSESSLFPYIFQSFIIDRGSRDGVESGDIFFSYSSTTAQTSDRPARAPSLVAATALVRENTSTLVILRLLDKTLSTGDSVSLVKRVKFN